MDQILIRAGVAIVIALAGVLCYVGWTRWHVRRLGRMAQALAGLEERRVGVAAILYFTTPQCVPCRTQQRPALAELGEQFGERVQVIQVDATEHADLADYWGVLTVPTTFIIDETGRPRHVNHGVATAANLRQQLRDVGVSPAPVKTGHAGQGETISNLTIQQRAKPCDEH
jgi:thioredoxin 1